MLVPLRLAPFDRAAEARLGPRTGEKPPLDLVTEDGADLTENGAKHLRRENARVRVVAGAMIAVEQRHGPSFGRQFMPTTMSERYCSEAKSEGPNHTFVRDSAQRKNDRQIFHRCDAL